MSLPPSPWIPGDRPVFLVSDQCHPQNIEVVRTRAEPLGFEVIVADLAGLDSKIAEKRVTGLLVQNPGTDGVIHDYTKLFSRAHANSTAPVTCIVSGDPMAIVLAQTPAEMGADIAVGTMQRFGVPLGFGGPHAGYMACKEDRVRKMPGRIIGLSKDVHGRPGFRLALQTREQHIRRDKATSNICMAQALLAIMASMYAVYHGPEGLRAIARRIHDLAVRLANGLDRLGYEVSKPFFDTLKVRPKSPGALKSSDILALASARQINLRPFADGALGIALDEQSSLAEIDALLSIFAGSKDPGFRAAALKADAFPVSFQQRGLPLLPHPVFNTHHSETEMLRYVRKLEARDLSLAFSMIPLGSCTMKLNATAEMFPVSWREFSSMHPFAPTEQTLGYARVFQDLEGWLARLTGFDAVSLKPNSGAQGEYAGLLVIRKFHQSRGEGHSDVCLIPKSAHGTNPASAALAAMKIVVVDCDTNGNVDVGDLKAKATAHSKNLAALMITYPSTHGVFETAIREICDAIHASGGQVYMDGANLNAQVGLCLPGTYGPDVCHINLHKTFSIPHGGGGPGMGPICVKSHLSKFLPEHPVIPTGTGPQAITAVSSAPWGSASILVIPWMYIRMMGFEGLKRATQVAILSANYIARKLDPHFPVLYRGEKGLVAHECIVDLRPLKAKSGVEVEDVAKRLMDYGFHAPTISFPVPGTMMIEPTESEPLSELDRFCEAMLMIREEIREIEMGKADQKNNLLKNAPHTAELVCADQWTKPYSRERAAFPSKSTRERKFWTAVGRIDNVYGDRNLVCTCSPTDSY